MELGLEASLRLPSGLVLPNRLAKAAMTEALADCARRPSADLLRLYRRWASSGAGLLITGNVGIDRAHPVRARDVILDDRTELAPFRTWAETAKAGGARVVMQLNHAGRQTLRVVNSAPLGPSAGGAVPVMYAFARPRAASEAEIQRIITAHAEAAARAQHAGFDGVQIHAAHGYLINQFLAPDINCRSDAWGGSLHGRARLLRETVRAVRNATKPPFSVLVKLNSSDFSRGGLSEQDALAVVELLAHEAVDLLEISGGRYESGAAFGYNVEHGGEEAYFAGFARRARKLTATPLMLTGGMRTAATMRSALQSQCLDVAGLARPMLLDPDYPRALLEGRVPAHGKAPRIGVARLESAAEMAWWYAQIARLGHGHEPDPKLSPLRALAAYLFGDLWQGMHQRWTLRRLPAPSTALEGPG